MIYTVETDGHLELVTGDWGTADKAAIKYVQASCTKEYTATQDNDDFIYTNSATSCQARIRVWTIEEYDGPGTPTARLNYIGELAVRLGDSPLSSRAPEGYIEDYITKLQEELKLHESSK